MGAAVAPVLQLRAGMNFDTLLTRCRALELRAAALYRSFASRTRHDPELCALWTALARDEEKHAQAIVRAAGGLEAADRRHTTLGGWEEALQEIEARLAQAEHPEIGADVDRQLVAALALERTEHEALSQRLLSILPAGERPRSPEEHTSELVAFAERHGTNPAVAFEAALLRAQHGFRHAS